MRKFSFTMLIMMLFSFVVENLSGVKQVNAETTKTELINENYLKIDYDFETKDESNIWRVGFKQQSEDEKFDQRLKLKVTDEQDKTIEYPVVDNMRQKDDWLVEEKFSQSMEGQIVLSVPKSVEKLKLYVQLDQRKSDDDSAKIHEDTLAIKKPFVLEMKKEKEAKQPDVKKKEEATTASSEEFIGPKTLQQMKADDKQETMNRANLRAANSTKYQNKAPVYNKDDGTPTYSWKPNDQENVINHQGGNDNTGPNDWDGLQSWNTKLTNYTNSYIRYGMDDGREDIALRKYATQTDKPDEFDVRLNVRGNSITKPGVDIFFVMDNSASMGYTSSPYGIKDVNGITRPRKYFALSSLDGLIEKFKKDIPQDSGYMRIGGVVYGSKIMSTYDLSNNTNDWDTMAKKYRETNTEKQNTYTQGGLIEAQKKLQASGNDRRKIVFLLTDGAPTVSLRPKAGKRDTSIYYDNIRITGYTTDPPSTLLGEASVTYLRWNDGRLPPIYENRPINIANIEGGGTLTVWSHLDMANSEAANLRDSGIEIQTIAIGVEKSQFEKHTKDELVKGLYRMATKRAGATGDTANDHYFYYAENEEDFDPSFNEWYDSVLSTVENGIIEDPLGDMVELVEIPDVSPKVTDVSTRNGTGAKNIANAKQPILDKSNPRKVRVTNINLFGNQEIQIDYRVRLKTNDNNFESNKWYKANGKTTLQPTPDRSDDLLEFGVPSVKARTEDFEIPVEKIWDDTYKGAANYWGIRGSSIEAELQMKDKNTGTFKKVDSLELNAGNQWKKTFPAVDGRTNIYRIKEVSRTPGYAPVTMNYQAFTQAELGNNKVQLTNKLLTGSTHFYKYKEDGKTPFATSDLPRFSVTHENGKLLADNLKPDSSGKVTIENIPIGTYTLKEDYAPAGYNKMADVKIKVVDNAAGNGVIITFADNKGAGYVIKNELKKDTTIPIEKVWEDKYQGTDNYWGKRGKNVDFKIQEKNGSQWVDVETVTLPGKDGSWKGSFKTSKDAIHRIVEVGKTPGYDAPEDKQGEFTYDSLRKNGGDGTAKIVNNLLKGEASFNKFLEDGKTPFTGSDLPKFTVKRTDGKELVKDITPDKDGKVTIKDIPVGEFVIEETYVPKGFKKMANISLKAVEKKVTQGSNTKYIVETTMDNSSTPVNKINELKDYNLYIAKLGHDGIPVGGAEFEVTGPNNYKKKIKEDIPFFSFAGLKHGTYQVRETEAPEGHQLMDTAFQFTINLDGTVTFAEHPNVISTTYVLSDGNTVNSVSLTIKNKKALPGVLPRTGGTSTKLFFKIAFGLAITAGLLSGFYWLYYRKKS
ncbi:SpaA isopeptide-forming pilin-related protein [Enterococcus malodoratus]|uniref:SpaA isopeptide-forming pilin-related protein n=1 Tax=Enterococcus malodoratus TaxID=71451 RepID=UPI003FD123A2